MPICCDCNEKLFGSHIPLFLHLQGSSIISSPAGCQSANSLVESHWKIIVHMSRAYLTEKQMPRSFWYYAIKHSARMMNMIPDKYKNKLASPFMLVHGVCQDQRTWLPLFLICYFHHESTAMLIVPRTKPTHWVALYLVDLLHPMRSLSTILATNISTNQIAVELIIIGCPNPFTLQLFMTVALS